MERIVCDFCPHARHNAMSAFVPEPDMNFGDMRWAGIDPGDFEEDQPRRVLRKRGRKTQECCSNGHLYSVDGTVDKSGAHRCRICAAEWKRKRYHAKKEAAA
jgi:hypothetical protein